MLFAPLLCTGLCLFFCCFWLFACFSPFLHSCCSDKSSTEWPLIVLQCCTLSHRCLSESPSLVTVLAGLYSLVVVLVHIWSKRLPKCCHSWSWRLHLLFYFAMLGSNLSSHMCKANAVLLSCIPNPLHLLPVVVLLIKRGTSLPQCLHIPIGVATGSPSPQTAALLCSHCRAPGSHSAPGSDTKEVLWASFALDSWSVVFSILRC